MSKILMLTTITSRDRLPEFIALYKENKVEIHYVSLGKGTAGHDRMSMLGLSSAEKAVCFAIITDGIWPELKSRLQKQLLIDVPGTGIAFTIPLSSISGKRELSFFTDGLNYTREGVSEMTNTDNELVIVICNQGYSETVMDAARSVGAAGGTVIHAKGTGARKAEAFLGISLASEKDVIFIVSKTAERTALMDAITKEAGIETPAGAISFSLPVSDTAGLRLLE